MSDDSALGWLDFIQTHPKLTELAFFFSFSWGCISIRILHHIK